MQTPLTWLKYVKFNVMLLPLLPITYSKVEGYLCKHVKDMCLINLHYDITLQRDTGDRGRYLEGQYGRFACINDSFITSNP